MPKEQRGPSDSPRIIRVLDRLKGHINHPPPLFYDPFASPGGLAGEWDYFYKRVNLTETEGYFGPTATLDRSRIVEDGLSDSVGRIINIRSNWKQGFETENYSDISKKIEALSARAFKKKPALKEKIEQNLQNFERADNIQTKKNVALDILKCLSETLSHGDEDELAWTEMAVGLTSAYFEYYQAHANKPKNIELRPNQLSYMLLLTLNQGKYEFGDLETANRGIELPTGEGKTYAFNLAAGIMVMRGEKVHIIEPNYISAKDHAEQMGGFFLDFLNIGVGVAIDVPEKGGYTTTTYVGSTGLIEQVTGEKTNRQSFLYGLYPKKTEIITPNPEYEDRLEPADLTEGRKKVWSQQIVFCDKNSVAFDYLESQEIGPLSTKSRYGLPDLGKVTAFVTEAEKTMIKDGNHPWAISRKINDPKKVWDMALQLCGLSDNDVVQLVKAKGQSKSHALKNLSPEDKREISQFVLFNLWAVLEENKDKFTEGEGGDYYYASGKLIVSSRALLTAQELLNNALQKVFINPHIRANWLQHNYPMIQTALQVFFGLKPRRDSIMPTRDNNPILIDKSGLPLEKHQFEPLTQIFFVMQNNWEAWKTAAKRKLAKDASPGEILRTMIIDNRDKFELSMQTNRIYPQEMFLKYGNLRFSSGTLLSSSNAFYKLYGAEIFKISRHLPIVEPDMSLAGPTQLWVGCPDGGYAQIQFHPDFLFLQQIKYRANYLRANKRAGLIICSNIEEARELKDLMPESETVMITAEEELKERGKLAQEVNNMTVGKIIITTEMAARDIDPKSSGELIQNGGPEVIGVGIPSDENSMWQLLQRAVRGDQPGSRLLMISQKHIKPIRDRLLIRGGSKETHQIQKAKIEGLWNDMFRGDHKAKTELFKEILNYLRQEDEIHLDHLRLLYIRDQRLEKLKAYLINQWAEYDKTHNEMSELWSQILINIVVNFNNFVMGFQIQNPNIGSKAEYESRLKNAWDVFLSQEVLKYANLQ